MKYTKHHLKKAQGLLEQMGYTVRYEKGNFQSGYCLVEQRKVAIVNKFFDTEARINALLDILSKVDAEDVEVLEGTDAKLFHKLIPTLRKKEEEEEERKETAKAEKENKPV